jgi:hypothetical protein
LRRSGIFGKVTFTGTPPPGPVVPFDPYCSKLTNVPSTIRWYLVDPKGGLADVFIYIKEGLPSDAFSPPKVPAVLNQTGCSFVPYVTGIQIGQKLLVRNSDPVMHNVHVVPRQLGNKESNRAQLPGMEDLEFTFNTSEIFLTIKCDVHPWMFAYVSVVQHPFFVVSDSDGAFRIDEVPAGRYIIEAVHRKAGTIAKEVTAEAGILTETTFAFEAKQL